MPAALLAVGLIPCWGSSLTLKLHERRLTDYDSAARNPGAAHDTLGPPAVHFEEKGDDRGQPIYQCSEEIKERGVS